MSAHWHEHKVRWIHSQVRAGVDEPIMRSGPSPRRLVSFWGGQILTVFLIAAGAIGLIHCAPPHDHQDQEIADADQPEAGIIVRSEVNHLWLPPALIELANHQALCGFIRTHDDLRQYLERRGQKGLWYALTMRGYQANGAIVDMLFVRRPYQMPSVFPEFLQTLAMAVEHSSGPPDREIRNASVHILPADFWIDPTAPDVANAVLAEECSLARTCRALGDGPATVGDARLDVSSDDLTPNGDPKSPGLAEGGR
jgi:hypothetical protein